MPWLSELWSVSQETVGILEVMVFGEVGTVAGLHDAEPRGQETRLDTKRVRPLPGPEESGIECSCCPAEPWN